MVVIGYYVDDKLGGTVLTSMGEAVLPTADDLISEFLREYRLQGDSTEVWRFTWDIDRLVIPILKALPQPALESIAAGERAMVQFQGRKLSLWYPRREGHGQCLAIKDWGSKREIYIWPISSHCPEGIEPPHDAVEVELYGRKILDIYARVLGFQPQPNMFHSPISVLRPYLMGINYPSVDELHPLVANLAARAMSPPWFEAHQLGFWDHAVDIDLSNAYGSILRDLPDWRLGEWKESETFQPEAQLGLCECDLMIDPNVRLHPILCEMEDSQDGLTVAPVGKINGIVLTSRQISFIRKWKLGEVAILRGVWWFPKSPPRHPLRTIVDRLIVQREVMTANLRPVDAQIGRYLAKRILVGLWGYTARWDWDRGKPPDRFYNPVWAAEITTRIPLRVADLIYRKKLMAHVICIAVDGFTVDCPVELAKEEVENGWKIHEEGPILCLSSHHVWMGDRHPAGLYLHQVVDLIRSDPRAVAWTVPLQRVATLGDAIVRNDLNLLGCTIDTTATVYLHHNHNRRFPRLPRRGRDLLTTHYTSMPYHWEDIKEAVCSV